MAKPICVIKVSNRVDFGNSRPPIIEIQSILDEKLNDYHVLVTPFKHPHDGYYDPIQVQVFYEKDFTDIQYEELRKLILESLPPTTQK